MQLRAVASTLQKLTASIMKIYDVIDAAQGGNICCHERLSLAICSRDALHLVMTSFEVAKDGDVGANSGMAPAMLHAVRSVMHNRHILHFKQ